MYLSDAYTCKTLSQFSLVTQKAIATSGAGAAKQSSIENLGGSECAVSRGEPGWDVTQES